MRSKIAILACIALSACATSGPALDKNVDPGVAAVVEMTPALKFRPPELRIKAGDTVEFRNVSAFTHTAQTVAETAGEREIVRLPAGAAPFSSGPVGAGQIFRTTFEVPGTYRYFCGPHHDAGMIGSIVVEAS